MTQQEAFKSGFMEKMASHGIPEEVATQLYKEAFEFSDIGKFFQENPQLLYALLGGAGLGGLGGLFGGTGGGLGGLGLGGLLGYFAPQLLNYFNVPTTVNTPPDATGNIGSSGTTGTAEYFRQGAEQAGQAVENAMEPPAQPSVTGPVSTAPPTPKVPETPQVQAAVSQPTPTHGEWGEQTAQAVQPPRQKVPAPMPMPPTVPEQSLRTPVSKPVPPDYGSKSPNARPRPNLGWTGSIPTGVTSNANPTMALR